MAARLRFTLISDMFVWYGLVTDYRWGLVL